MDKQVIMPPERKVVDKDNKVVNIGEAAQPVQQLPAKDRIVLALRDMANQIESGKISEPDFLVVIPKLKTGEIPLIFMGDPIPTVMLEGILHKVITRMALES